MTSQQNSRRWTPTNLSSPFMVSTGLQSASRAEEEAFHGPSHFNELGLAFGYVLGRSSALPTSMLACASVSSVSAHSRFVTYQYS